MRPLHERKESALAWLANTQPDGVPFPAYGAASTNGATPPDALPWPRPASQLEIRPIEWLATNFLLGNEYSMIAAPGGTYKSTIMLSIAAAVANGSDVLGAFPVPRPRKVLVISEEDPEEVIKNRLLAICAGHGYDPTLLDDIHVFALDGVRVNALDWQLHIAHVAKELDVGLIAMDPLAELLEGENVETNNEMVRPVVQWLRRLSKSGHATLVVHHHGKESEARKGQDRVRGGGAWANGARAVYYLENKDQTLWLGCDKISRIPKPKDPWELRMDVTAEPDNAAMWTTATIEVAHKPTPAWGVADPHRISPSERTALLALDRHRDEALSWTKWFDVSGLSKSSLSRAIPNLKRLRFIEAESIGVHRGQTKFGYRITGEGLAECASTPVNSH